MPRLSVCVEMIFANLPFAERLEAVRAAGYDAFEFWGWQNKDLPEIDEARRRLGLAVAAFGVSGGTLMEAGNHAAYCDTLGQAAEWARRLECPALIVTTGNTLPDAPRERQLDTLRRGLEQVARAAEAGGVTAVLEPLNSKVDHKGYFLDHVPEGLRLVREAGSPALKLLFDMYHGQIMDGDIIATLEASAADIAHYHVADVPGRHEPGTGELSYGQIFRRIDATGYGGYVGLEFRPTGDHSAALAQVKALTA